MARFRITRDAISGLYQAEDSTIPGFYWYPIGRPTNTLEEARKVVEDRREGRLTYDGKEVLWTGD